jgi:hypothetical protein
MATVDAVCAVSRACRRAATSAVMRSSSVVSCAVTSVREVFISSSNTGRRSTWTGDALAPPLASTARREVSVTRHARRTTARADSSLGFRSAEDFKAASSTSTSRPAEMNAVASWATWLTRNAVPLTAASRTCSRMLTNCTSIESVRCAAVDAELLRTSPPIDAPATTTIGSSRTNETKRERSRQSWRRGGFTVTLAASPAS